MTKKDVYVVVDTPNKAKKLKELLDMFGEPMYSRPNHRNSMHNGTVSYDGWGYGFFDGKWRGFNTKSSIHNGKEFKKVSIKELKQILAKEHLKSGDWIIAKCSYSDCDYLVKVDEIRDNVIMGCFSFAPNNKWTKLSDYSGVFIKFKRYATPEEIALLEPKQKELEVGKWYKHPNNKYPNWLVYYGGNKKCYGFRTSGVWDYDYKNEWFEYLNAYPMVEATPQEVESALIEEAKKRYKNLDFKNVKYLHEINELWTSSEYFDIQLFANGKWAEVIENDDKPNVGDVCKFWDDDDEFIIDTLLSIEEIDKYNLLYKSSNCKWCFRNAKKLTQQEVIDLLFNNGGN